MTSHVRTWRRAQQLEFDPDDLDFARRQYRRRMQSSAMLGLLAPAIVVGQLVISRAESDLAKLSYWGLVVLVVGWVCLLAVVDIWATKHHFSRMRQTYLVEQARLQAELRRLQASRGNGKAPRGDHDADTED
jgi:hypothetical protein